MSETTDRRWNDADRELVARAMFKEAHEGDHDAFRWEDLRPHYEEQAEAALDALAADGRLADPQEAHLTLRDRTVQAAQASGRNAVMNRSTIVAFVVLGLLFLLCAVGAAIHPEWGS